VSVIGVDRLDAPVAVRSASRRPVLDVEDWGDLQPELNAPSKAGAIMEMIAKVDERMLETLAVRGTPEECAAELHRRSGDLTDRGCAYSPGYAPGAQQARDLVTALAWAPGTRRRVRGVTCAISATTC